MRSIFSYLAFFAVCSIVCLQACERLDNVPVGVGNGGKATLNISANHHGKDMENVTVYIKYNSASLPPDMRFDDSALTKNNGEKAIASFYRLKKGTYYLFATGYDAAKDENVQGGVSFKISKSETYVYPIKVSGSHK